MRPDPGPPALPARLLVAWFRFGLNGSIARFLRFAQAARRAGHRVDFASLTGETRPEWPDLPGILGPDDLARGRWDAVMVPGAGNERDPLESLAALRHERFGRRLQHVLNDASGLARFAAVNAHFAPDTIVFNNSAWTPPEMRRLTARAFHVLPGAVDAALFHPKEPGAASAASHRGPWAVGTYARKNLPAVLDAVESLGRDVTLHVFGAIPGEWADRVDRSAARGRLIPAGDLFGEALARWYRTLDAFVAVESSAGWCNPAAEAMASGLPCVVGPGGTKDFVDPGRNASLVAAPEGAAIADGLRAFLADPAKARALGAAAADSMLRFGWDDYAARLVDLATAPVPRPYYRVPELGLLGKWDPAERLAGLEPLLAEAAGASVLDLGAAEGLVSATMARAGARVVHAFELDPARVRAAADLLERCESADSEARVADLSDWNAFTRVAGDVLRDRYDIVLFLGLYHHLPEGARAAALRGALARDAGLVPALRDAGWALHSEQQGNADTGWLGLFRRDPAGSRRIPAPQEPAAEVTR